jgi:PAS domain S-box-containing protein
MKARTGPSEAPRRSPSPRETIDLLAKSRQAAFGMDSTERVVYWNQPCEQLLGFPARTVLGKHCFDVIAGRDENGNWYCSMHCAIARQARSGEPVHPMTLRMKDASGTERALRVRTFAVPAVRAELSVVIHVVAEGSRPTRAEAQLETLSRLPPAAPGPLTPANPTTLTSREKEILLAFAEGLSTSGAAEKLGIAPVTIRNHTQRILLKFKVHSKLAAVVFAVRHELL